MDYTTTLVVFAVAYCILLFFDSFFKSCMHYPYIQFLKGTGLEVGFFHLKWSTTVFNRLIVRFGSSRSKLLSLWFDAGMYITLALMPVVVMLLITATFQVVVDSNTSLDDKSLVIEPLIPGFNTPVSDIGYYAFALAVCSVIHELGHAIAAVREDIHLICVGISAYFIVPIAFVNISSEKLSSIGNWRVLRVICAGVWHNIVLGSVAYVLYIFLPIALAFMYHTNIGVSVTAVKAASPLQGPRGLNIGDTITLINDCTVTDLSTWHDCLSQARKAKPGFCVGTDIVNVLDESLPLKQMPNGEWNCCNPSRADALCFEYMENGDGTLELPQHMCLPARKIIEHSEHFCLENSCSKSLHCIKPMLPNSTFILKIQRARKAPVIYTGHPADVYLSVTVSSFVPKTIFSTWAPDCLQKMLEYLCLFSLGLAVVNMIPCVWLDGQYISNSVVGIVLKGKTSKKKNSVATIVTFAGTLLFFINFVFAIVMRLLT